jgi:ABC-2 type transport system permease protein
MTAVSTATAPEADPVRTRPVAPGLPPVGPIPATRLVGVELRKMFDTRAGFWMLAAVVVAAVLASGAVILFAPDDEVKYSTFAGAIGFPMSVILPVIAILGVTAEWSQRTGLATFTMVPHRGRVLSAKLAATLLVAVASMGIAMVVGVGGNLIGSAITGLPTVWDTAADDLGGIVLGNVLGTLLGFVLGVVLRSSAAAIVGYFVMSMLVPTLSMLLAEASAWYRDLQPWVDFPDAQTSLYDGLPPAEGWAHLGVAALIWLVVPMIVGTRLVLRSEVK